MVDLLSKRIMELQRKGVRVNVKGSNIILRQDRAGNRLLLDPDNRLVVVNAQGSAVTPKDTITFAKQQKIPFVKKGGKIFFKQRGIKS